MGSFKTCPNWFWNFCFSQFLSTKRKASNNRNADDQNNFFHVRSFYVYKPRKRICPNSEADFPHFRIKSGFRSTQEMAGMSLKLIKIEMGIIFRLLNRAIHQTKFKSKTN